MYEVNLLQSTFVKPMLYFMPFSFDLYVLNLFLKSCSKDLHTTEVKIQGLWLSTRLLSCWLNTGTIFSSHLSYSILLGRFITKYC